MGAPFKLQADTKTLKLITGLGKIQATTKECAAVLGVSEPTYIRFKTDHPEAAEAYEAGAGDGRVSLRRQQFAMAETNPTMAIWLGKQYLGQADKQEVSGPAGGPMRVEATDFLKSLRPEERDSIRAVFERAARRSDGDPESAGPDRQPGVPSRLH